MSISGANVLLNKIPKASSRGDALQISKLIGVGIVLFLILTSFLVSIAPIAYENVRSSDGDQGAYLRVGLQIRHYLAPIDANLNPLYPLILSLVARTEIGYFTIAKTVSILIGLLGLLVIYAVARRVACQSIAIATTLMTAMNSEYRIAAGFVDVEVLLVPLTLIAWYWASRGIQSAAEGEENEGWHAFIAGLLLGVVYLAKGTGMLLAIAFVLALLWTQGPALVKHRSIWCFAAGFSTIAVFLWAYNLTHHGNPLYNAATSHALWLDRWEDYFVHSPEEQPTLLTYLQTHTAEEIARRLANGVLKAPRQWYQASRFFWLPSSPSRWITWGYLGANTLVLAKVTHRVVLRWRARRGWFLFSVTAAGLFYLSFGWYYPVDSAPRFVLPLVSLLYIAPLWLLWEETAFSPHSQKWVSGSLILICLIQAGTYLRWHSVDLELLARMKVHDQQENEDSIRFMEAVARRTYPGEPIILGPTHALPEWLAFDRERLFIPYARQDWHTFNTWMMERGIRYAVLDHECWKRRHTLLAQYWDFRDGLVATELPPGWTLVEPSSFPCNPCLFAFDKASLEPENPASVRYEDSFALLGYDIEPSPPQSGQPWHIILYWQVLNPVDEDIHVFVHILDDAEELVGQHDNTMIQGRLPDYALLPNTIVRNSHPLPSLPRGTYSVYIGLYQWETQDRLSAFQGEQPVLNAYPEVVKVTVQSSDH